MMVVAIPWQAYLLTGSASDTAWVTATSVLPYALVGIWAGVLADRTPPKSLMVLTEGVSSVLIAILTVSAYTHVTSIPVLAVIAFAVGCLTVAFDASSAVMLPRMVQTDDLPSANARVEGVSAFTRIIGPSAAGALLGTVGVPVVFMTHACTLALATIGSLLLRAQPTAGSKQCGESPGRSALVGLRYVLRDRTVSRLTLSSASLAFATGTVGAMMIPLFRGIGDYTGSQTGLIYAAGGLGWLIAAVLIAKTRFSRQVPAPVAGAAALSVVAAVATPAVLNPIASGVGTALLDGSVYYVLIATITLRQIIVPRDLLGRVHSTARSLANLGSPLGAGIAGVVAAGLGPRGSWLLLAPMAMVVTLVMLARAVRLGKTVSV
ncbi:putative MFS family arabinose efflux permease [Flexivirga oryzae]|uniref:Putative MFS family arabinose efflux permease n=2 Tax=Flexivirga oryzae TaxID=1794944 RepID=A0A839MZR9_9MICO|nr:putative MFS family arabinose efflux permease [Flexivirga oryzae]